MRQSHTMLTLRSCSRFGPWVTIAIRRFGESAARTPSAFHESASPRSSLSMSATSS